MSAFFLKAPPCWFVASRISPTSLSVISFSRRWRAERASQRTGGAGGGPGGGPLGRPRAGEQHEPADGEGASAAGGHLDRHLVVGTADAPRPDLERGSDGLDGLL